MFLNLRDAKGELVRVNKDQIGLYKIDYNKKKDNGTHLYVQGRKISVYETVEEIDVLLDNVQPEPKAEAAVAE